MSTFLQDWMIRRAMTPRGGTSSNIIYRLENHTCDGTASTCIDTGIKLFSQSFIQQHPKFQIQLSYTTNDKTDKAHILRCCRVDSETNYSGFNIRYNNVGIQSRRYSVRVRFRQSVVENLVAISSEADVLLPVNNLIITFDFTISESVLFGVKNRNSGLPDTTNTFNFQNLFDTTPFVIGGSVINGVDASDGWKEMWKGTIDSLIIRDITSNT